MIYNDVNQAYDSLVLYGGTDYEGLVITLTYNDFPANVVYQPSFTRWRHRYRGPRESLKINQEIGQYYYDINVMRGKMDALDTEFETQVTNIMEGTTFDTIEWVDG